MFRSIACIFSSSDLLLYATYDEKCFTFTGLFRRGSNELSFHERSKFYWAVFEYV